MAKPAQELFSPEKLVEALPSFGYQLFFVDPRSSAILDAKVDKFIRLIYTSAKQVEAGEFPSWEKQGVIEAWLADDASSVDPALLTENETDTIIAEIKAGVVPCSTTIGGAEVNYELDKNLPQEFRPDIPKLLVVPNADPALPNQRFANEEKAPDVELVRLEGLCGHWVQLERPAEVEKIVGDWVERMAAKGWVA
ncbi:hypothetical protein FRC08_001644 [Ceratobasidium sp. 394]|nr:hypothetical protein FRC08_001644 [Ceratobasidium sp. 394]